MIYILPLLAPNPAFSPSSTLPPCFDVNIKNIKVYIDNIDVTT